MNFPMQKSYILKKPLAYDAKNGVQLCLCDLICLLLFFRKSCINPPSLTNFTSNWQNQSIKECSCSRGFMDCPKGAEGATPPKVQVSTK